MRVFWTVKPKALTVKRGCLNLQLTTVNTLRRWDSYWSKRATSTSPRGASAASGSRRRLYLVIRTCGPADLARRGAKCDAGDLMGCAPSYRLWSTTKRMADRVDF